MGDNCISRSRLEMANLVMNNADAKTKDALGRSGRGEAEN